MTQYSRLGPWHICVQFFCLLDMSDMPIVAFLFLSTLESVAIYPVVSSSSTTMWNTTSISQDKVNCAIKYQYQFIFHACRFGLKQPSLTLARIALTIAVVLRR